MRRPDKRIPNSYEAVRSIDPSSRVVPRNSETRTEIWRWSNLLREHVYKKAFNIDNKKRTVLDIGPGDR